MSGKYNRIVRVRPDFFNATDYLDYVAKRSKRDLYEYYSEVFKYALNYIYVHGFNYYIEPYKPRRKPKGFPMYEDVSKGIDIAYNFYKNKYEGKYGEKIYVADFIEILVYIYINEIFGKEMLDSLQADFKIKEVN